MKSIAVVALCLFAAAAGEAEPKADAAYLSHYGHAYGYGLHGYGYGHALGYHGYAGYRYPYRYGGYHHYGKRSADAEPEADAHYGYSGYYGHGYGHGYYGHGYGYGLHHAYAPYGYHGLYHY